MIEESVPTLFLIAGPNGAGKSTLYDLVMRPRIKAPFINADIIQAKELKNTDEEAAYEAAEIAAERRRAYISERRSFVTETVFSHPSKLSLVDQAKAAGFRVVLYHISLSSSDLSALRVKGRVMQGGHNVPDKKVRERYHRNGPLIRKAALKSDRAIIYDNSIIGTAPRRILSLQNGKIDYIAKSIPIWVRNIYLEDIQKLT